MAQQLDQDGAAGLGLIRRPALRRGQVLIPRRALERLRDPVRSPPPPIPDVLRTALTYNSVTDPTSVLSPLYEGSTCEPGGAALGKECTLGGFPSYSLNVSIVADV